MDISHIGLYILLGFGVGALGTLIGAGGGFILLPVLLLLFPDMPPEALTSISLAVVFINAASGSFAYSRLKRIDYRSGLRLALATLPGAIIGAYVTQYIPRKAFDIVLGFVLLAVAAFLLLKPGYQAATLVTQRHRAHRTVTDREGTTYAYSFNMVTGVAVSFVVGFLSSLLGIGGGVIHVPFLATVLHFPVPIATATSHFILAIMALAGTVAHIAQGNLTAGWPYVLSIGAGTVVGAQVGAWASHKIKPEWIIRTLAVALFLVGLRLVMH
ncbi:MAG: sulfite exporter TauE/SafE family protein [Flavobacteriales bacterium]|nr:sulfite exporter TauE/SafE family protein [Flavobacteriales bacterium]